MSDHYKVIILRGDEELANGDGEDTGYRWRDITLDKHHRTAVYGWALALGGRDWNGKLRHERTEDGAYIHYADLTPTWIKSGVPFIDARTERCRLAFVPVFEEDES